MYNYVPDALSLFQCIIYHCTGLDLNINLIDSGLYLYLIGGCADSLVISGTEIWCAWLCPISY
jgi:hypothetical protein